MSINALAMLFGLTRSAVRVVCKVMEREEAEGIGRDLPYRNLSARAANALSDWLKCEPHEVMPQAVALLSIKDISRVRGCGHKTIKEVKLWLGMYGMQLAGPSSEEIDARRLAKRIKFLEDRGYTVVAPINKEVPQ